MNLLFSVKILARSVSTYILYKYFLVPWQNLFDPFKSVISVTGIIYLFINIIYKPDCLFTAVEVQRYVIIIEQFFKEMTSWTVLTWHIGIKTEFQTKYLKSKYYLPYYIKILNSASDLKKCIFDKYSTLQQGTHEIGI